MQVASGATRILPGGELATLPCFSVRRLLDVASAVASDVDLAHQQQQQQRQQQRKTHRHTALIDPALPLSGSNALAQLTGARGLSGGAMASGAAQPALQDSDGRNLTLTQASEAAVAVGRRREAGT